MRDIKKFELIDFASRDNPEKFEEVICAQVIDTANQSFEDENSLEEIGQNLESVKEEVDLVKIKRNELEKMISDAKAEAVGNYIANQPEVVMDTSDEVEKLERIANIISEIRDRLSAELDGIIEKILRISYAIAAKVIDTELMSIAEDKFINVIKSKIVDVNSHGSIRLEVKDKEIAEALANSGIEVSVNSDMLSNDYKIIWCNGFLERNSSDIAAQVEETLIDYIRK